jgi:A/G-specific adenine glycosylase
MAVKASEVAAFRKSVWAHYKKDGRHDLPWRLTQDPYRIMVSEVMLQQTQVPRVLEKYKSFLKKFPTVRALAMAPLAHVLREWSGLGYNRRGKYLHDAARAIVQEYRGILPQDVALLRKIPGLGPYTASAIRVFAHNFNDALIETNVRAVYIHHFFNDKKIVSDAAILQIAHLALEGQDPRTWHWALMDYGVHIKKLHKNPARKAVAYTRQSKFEGSLRQVRGAILKQLHANKSLALLPFTKDRVQEALAGLQRDGMVRKAGRVWKM